MGLQRTVSFPTGKLPDWPQLQQSLRQSGETPALRMIDGLPAFPDEVPDPAWTELRIGLSGGMITVRKHDSAFRLTTWGTDDPKLAQSLNHLMSACRELGGIE